jgi:cold shock protein
LTGSTVGNLRKKAGDEPGKTLKWFNPDEGYGYITPDDGNEEVFFSYSATWGGGFRNLERGERVTHMLVEGWHGPQSENVSKRTSPRSRKPRLRQRPGRKNSGLFMY